MKNSDKKSTVIFKVVNGVKSYKYTSIMSVVGIIILIVAEIGGVDLTKYFILTIQKLSETNIDHEIIVVLLLTMGYIIDVRMKMQRLRQNLELKNKSYSVFKATMETLNDMMRNYIQSVQLYRIEMSNQSNMEIERELDIVTGKILDKLVDLEMSEVVNEEVLFDTIHMLKKRLTKN